MNHKLMMLFWFRRDLILFIFLGGLFCLPARAQQATPGEDEIRAMERIRTDFKEGSFERVQLQAKEFSRRFSSSSLRFEAQLIEAKAWYFLGQYQQALGSLVTPPAQVPSGQRTNYLFWQGESLLQLERWPEAEKKYRDLLALQPEKDLKLAVQLSLAWSLFKQNKETEAHQVLDPLVAGEGKESGEVGDKAAIYLARMLIAKSQGKDAAQLLETLLANKPPLGMVLQANYWLGEIAQADNRPADAIAKYNEVTGNAKAFPRSLVAQCWFGTGVCQQLLQLPDKAMQAFEQAYTIGDDEQLKLASFKLYLQSAQALQRLPEAEATLRAFAQKDVVPITASAALFAIGLSQAEQKQTDQAIGTLEAMLTAYPDSVWRAATYYRLGDLYHDKAGPDDKGALDSALKAYQACLDSIGNDKGSSPQEMQEQVIFKMGEIYYSQKDYNKAAANFQKVVTMGGPRWKRRFST